MLRFNLIRKDWPTMTKQPASEAPGGSETMTPSRRAPPTMEIDVMQFASHLDESDLSLEQKRAYLTLM